MHGTVKVLQFSSTRSIPGFLLKLDLSQYHGQISYPKKSKIPKKHQYDLQTHKKYAAAMSYLKSKKRRKLGVFVENKTMICDLLSQGQIPSHFFYCEDEVFKSITHVPESTQCIQVTEKQLTQLTDVGTNQGFMAVFDRPNKVEVTEETIPLIIFLDRIRDPGNVGTIIRSAAGAACSSVVSSPQTCSFWLPATLRASAAANYLVPLHEHLEFTTILETLPSDWQICFVETQQDDNVQEISSVPFYEADFRKPTLMIFGREAGGLSPEIKKIVIDMGRHDIVGAFIPTIAKLDSINVAMAASVLIFEMARQQKQLVKHNRSGVVEEFYSLSSKDIPENSIVDGLNSMLPPIPDNMPVNAT